MTTKIKFDCTACNATLHIPVTAAGKKIRCPKCQSVISVPKRKGEAPTESGDDHEAPPSPLQSPEWTSRLLPGKPHLTGNCPKCAKRIVLSAEEVLEKKLSSCSYCQSEFVVPVNVWEKLRSYQQIAVEEASASIDLDDERWGDGREDDLQNDHSWRGVAQTVNENTGGNHVGHFDGWDDGPDVQGAIEGFGNAVNDYRNVLSLKLKREVPEHIKELLCRNEMILYVGRSSEVMMRFSTFLLPLLLFLISLIPTFVIAVNASGSAKLVSLFFSILAGGFALAIRVLGVLSWKNNIYLITSSRLIARRGIFNRTLRTMPTVNVQMANINSGIIDRWLGLNTVVFASSSLMFGSIVFRFVDSASVMRAFAESLDQNPRIGKKD